MKHDRRYNGRRPQKARSVLFALVLAMVVVFAALLSVVLSGSHDEVRGDPGIMIVLGGRVLPSGQPSGLLADRLDEALEWLDDHPNTVVVVTGGKSKGSEVSEAEAMASYLTERGAAEEQILLEERATSTWENLVFSLRLLQQAGLEGELDEVLVVSNGFHLTRCRMLFGRAWGEECTLSTLAAPSSHLPSLLWMYVREPLALVKSFLFDRGV